METSKLTFTTQIERVLAQNTKGTHKPPSTIISKFQMDPETNQEIVAFRGNKNEQPTKREPDKRKRNPFAAD